MTCGLPNDFPMDDSKLNTLIQSGHSVEAVDGYLHHPDQSFGQAFNAVTKDVDSKGIDKIYSLTRQKLIWLIDIDKIRNIDQLSDQSRKILSMNAMHHRCLTWHRDRPERNSQLLFVPLDVAHCAGSRLESETEEQQLAAQIEELGAIFESQIDPVGLTIFRKVTDFEVTQRTTHGAFTPIAQCVQTDPKGNILKIQEWPAIQGKPSQKVVKQVTLLYYQTLTQIIRIIESQGINVPATMAKKLTKKPRKPRSSERVGFDQNPHSHGAA